MAASWLLTWQITIWAYVHKFGKTFFFFYPLKTTTRWNVVQLTAFIPSLIIYPDIIIQTKEEGRYQENLYAFLDFS